mmetsp:Transcript_29317/g.78431  ORF Transcript_29317/g.78431 Transcript_29317/m.78431 type:complete len:552 (+) Transcript_29317:2-1657(+)
MGMPAGAAPRRAAGDEEEDWYEEAWQYAVVETMMLLVLIMIAILFDTFWHYLTHYVERNTYRFGHPHQGRAQGDEVNHEHKQLYTVLLQRMGTEFMTLGELALVIFLFEKYGVFDSVASACSTMGDMKLPKTGMDWFHMAEYVHFSLFGGMCLYFIQMSAFVAGSIRRIRGWEEERGRRADLLRAGSFIDRQVSTPSFFGGLDDHEEYECMQTRFIDGVFLWQIRDNTKYNTLLWHLGLNPDRADGRSLRSEVETLLQDQFDFSAFLALSVEAAVDDAIEVHIASWCTVWLFLACAFPIHRWGHVSFSQLTLEAVVPPTVFWLALCLWVFRRQHASMALVARRDAGNDSSSDGETLTTESGYEISLAMSLERTPVIGYAFFHGDHLMRCAQIAGLLCSYVLSRLVYEPPDWQHPWVTSANVIAIACLWLVLLLWFYVEAPIFLALMSLPPRTSYATEQHIWHLLRLAGLGLPTSTSTDAPGQPTSPAAASSPGSAARVARFRRGTTDESAASLTAMAASPSAVAPGDIRVDRVVSTSGASARTASSAILQV